MESPSLCFSDPPSAGPDNDDALEEARSLSTRAKQLDAAGNYYEAQRLLHQALELVGPTTPSSSPTFSRLTNSLGETYLHMGRLDDAEQWFTKSLDASAASRDFSEIAASRENLARVQRAKRELFKAKALRMLGAPNDMRCSNYRCAGPLLRSPDFCICGGCKGAFYCSVDCQRDDFERHKRQCRRLGQ